jgi:RES domain-containing protein
MVLDEKAIRRLEAMNPLPWQGEVFRHMFGENLPDRENVRGARWNPAGVAAIYTSLEKATALAEAEYYINLQPLRPRARRVVYTVKVSLASVVDLSRWDDLQTFGISPASFSAAEYNDSQHLGGAVAWLKHDGMLAPSARTQGTNLIIFPRLQSADYQFSTVHAEVLA